METMLYFTFILASVLLIVIPGPNVFIVISTSISHGTKRGLQAVLGTSSAMFVQLFIAAMGTTWLVESLASGLQWLKWLGVGYLLYLGITQLHKAILGSEATNTHLSAVSSYTRGFLVSLTNPKTILFFAAFLPQFVSNNTQYLEQIIVLSTTFLILATLFDSLYAILASQLIRSFHAQKTYRLQHGISATLFIAASIWLALLSSIDSSPLERK